MSRAEGDDVVRIVGRVTRDERGVAMTEFALILPIFLVIVVGILAFGRVFFYWIETNQLASEAARWAAVDRNPYANDTPPQTLYEYVKNSATIEFQSDARVCIDFPDGGTLDIGDPVRVRVEKPFSFLPDPQRWGYHDPRILDDAHRAARRQRRPDSVFGGRAVRSMHMRLHREERGGILALSAVMIPVFILLAALVVDVGTWFTHKRQLQNRADSAALAAGVEYATRWAACVQNGDPLTKSLAATAIEDAARQYAGDPGVAGRCATPRSPSRGASTSRSTRPRTSWTRTRAGTTSASTAPVPATLSRRVTASLQRATTGSTSRFASVISPRCSGCSAST